MRSTKMIREIPVKLPSHRVWDKLADIGNICHGHSAVSKSFITSDLKTGVGATRHCDFTMMGASAEERVTKWDEVKARWLRAWSLCLGVTAMAALSACGGGGGGTVGTTDNAVPTLEITSDVTGVASAPFKVTFTFSDGVTIPSPGGVLPFATKRGSLIQGSFTKLSASSSFAQLLPHDGQTADFELTVPPGAYKNASGTTFSAVSYTFKQPLYTLGPVPIWSDDSSDIFITGPVQVTLTFDSVLTTALTSNQLTITGGGSISNFSKRPAPGNDVYTLTFTPPPGVPYGSVTIELPKNAVSAGGVGNYLSNWSRGVNTP